MADDRFADTSPSVVQQWRALIARLSPAERVRRALALSAMARDFAWAGARRNAGGGDPEAVRQRFLEQVYGAEVAARVRASLTGKAAGGRER